MFADTPIGIRELRDSREGKWEEVRVWETSRRSEKCELKSFEEDLREEKPEEPATKPRKRSKEELQKYVSRPDVCQWALKLLSCMGNREVERFCRCYLPY